MRNQLGGFGVFGGSSRNQLGRFGTIRPGDARNWAFVTSRPVIQQDRVHRPRLVNGGVFGSGSEIVRGIGESQRRDRERGRERRRFRERHALRAHGAPTPDFYDTIRWGAVTPFESPTRPFAPARA